MRTLAIGDIHGCYRSLTAIAQSARFAEGDRIVTLGDYVDRGPDTKSVIEWLIEWDARGVLIALRGNHELMMLASPESERHMQEWLSSGGKAVLASYRASDISGVPEAHLKFLRSRLRPYASTKSHFFVHANAYPDIPLQEQPDYMLYWEPFGEPAAHESGKVMICGHTPQRTGVPMDVGHAICIDTWACGRGWLTCLDVDSLYCWQANERGDTRSFWLEDGPG